VRSGVRTSELAGQRALDVKRNALLLCRAENGISITSTTERTYRFTRLRSGDTVQSPRNWCRLRWLQSVMVRGAHSTDPFQKSGLVIHRHRQLSRKRARAGWVAVYIFAEFLRPNPRGSFK
jgi:hypothetical protein